MTQMSSKERVLCAFAGGEPDRVPMFDFIYSRKLYKEVLHRVPEYYNGEDAVRCAAKVGCDFAVVPLGGFGGLRQHSESADVYQDEWGTTYRQNAEVSWPADAPIAYPLKQKSDWQSYRVPDPSEPGRVSEVKTALKVARETETAVFGCVRGPFTAAWLLFGIERFSLLLYDDPDWLDDVLTVCTDFSVEGGRRMIDAGVDGITFADDYGSVNGPFMSPVLFQRHILPQLSRMVACFRRMGVPVMMHSDGNIRPLLDAIVAGTEINAYHPIERGAGMDLAEVKRTFGKGLCLIGNVDNKTTLVTGSADDVRSEAIDCIRTAAPGGGYILASDHSLKDDMPNENIFALHETGRRYGGYPISID
jgi:uroporphyrinogen decarboxylase